MPIPQKSKLMPPVKIKNPLKRLAYRWLRNDMVTRMRMRKTTWAQINQMLRAFGQFEVKQVHWDDDVMANRVTFFDKNDFKPKGLPDFKHIPPPPKQPDHADSSK